MVVQLVAIAGLGAALWWANEILTRKGTGRWSSLAKLALFTPWLCVGLLLTVLGPNGTELRLTVGALRFLGEAASQARPATAPTVVVGGSREDADIWVPRLQDRFAAFSIDSAQSPPNELIVEYGENGASRELGPAGVILAEWNSERLVVGSRELPAGSVIQVIEGGATRTIQVSSDHSVTIDGSDIELEWTIKMPFVGEVERFWGTPTPQGRSYPLAALLNRTAESQSALSSFLFFDESGSLRLALLDPAVTIHTPAGVTIVYQREHRLPLQRANDRLRIRICALGIAGDFVDKPHEYLGVRDLRSGIASAFLTSTDTPVVQLALDTEEILNFQPELLERLEMQTASDSEFRRWHVTLVPDVLVPQAITFLSMPQRFAAGGQAILEQAPDGGWTARVPAGQLPVTPGQSIWLGDTAQAAVQIDTMTPGWVLIVWVLILAGLGIVVLTEVTEPHPKIAAIAGALQVMLAFKVLMSLKAWTGDRESFESHALALYSIGLVPLMIALSAGISFTLVRADWPRLSLLLALAGTTAVSGLFLVGPNAALLTVAVTAAALVIRTRPDLGSIIMQSSPWQWSWQFAHGLHGHVLRAAGAGLIIAVIRGALSLAGWRERLTGPVPIALSVFSVPLLIYLYSRVRVWWFRDSAGGGTIFASWLTFFFFGCVLASVFASDFGILLVLAAPLALDLVVVLVRQQISRRWILAVCGLLVVLAGVWRFMPEPVLTLVGYGGAEKSLLEWDRNKLRFLDYTYPQIAANIGRQESEELVIMAAVLARYRDNEHEWVGATYPAADISPQLGPTVLREHVPVAMLAADFGHLGVLLVVGALFLIAVASTYDRHGPVDPSAIRPTVTLIAGLVFACSSLYMIAANYDLVPFTGKNVYLFGLDSFSDLVEAAFLIGLAVRLSTDTNSTTAPANSQGGQV